MNIKEKTVLATLLHDIGKVRERYAGGANHAELTKRFLEKFDEELAELAYGHHCGRLDTLSKVREGLKDYAKIVCKADNLSAGLERVHIDFKAIKDSSLKEWKKRERKLRPMLSILSTVDLNKGKSEEMCFSVQELTLKPYYLKPKPFEGAECDYNFVSKMENDILKVLNSRYEFKKLLFTISNLLRKYLFFVPADTFEYGDRIPIPDTSLYEHLRLASIFALTLLNNSKKFVLIGGDISGIQDFIAKVTYKKALKFLKGRSFFLELLNLAAVHRICRDLKIPPTQVVSVAAGKFTLIAPLTENYAEILKNLRREINGELINLGLYMAIAWREIEYEEVRNFNILMKKIGDDLETAKLRRYHELMEDEYEFFFGSDYLTESTSKRVECDVCKTEVIKGQTEEIEIPAEEGEEPEKLEVCKRCFEIYTLGDKLVKVGKLVHETKGREFYIGVYEKGGGDIDIFGIGLKIGAIPEEFSDADYVYVANSVNFLADEFLKNGVGCGFRFFNIEVSDTSLDKLAKSSKGAKYIGILKMDGDDMGKAFTEGVRNWWKKHGSKIVMSPSRFATMSSLVELFFGYCVDRICREGKFFTRESFAKSPNVYVVFSGGDDLFVIGPWDQIVDLALKIQEEYTTFTSNPNLTISAGITIVQKKFPVYKSYVATVKSMEDAKDDDKLHSGKKSVVALFGHKLRFEDVKESKIIKNFLVDRIEGGNLSRAIIHAFFRSLSNGGKYRCKWATKYVIARYQERYGDLSFLDNKIDEMFKEKSFSKFLVALRWAELLTEV